MLAAQVEQVLDPQAMELMGLAAVDMATSLEGAMAVWMLFGQILQEILTA
jgi:hypothetical protein